MSLVNYSESSDSESGVDELAVTTAKKNYQYPAGEIENDQLTIKRIKLDNGKIKTCLPNALTQLGSKKAPLDDANAEYDNPAEHDGRIRSFKHERGNWATYVYIPVDQNIFEDILELCQNELVAVADLHICADFHLSLSRTVVLQYHLIESFMKSLMTEFLLCKKFDVSLQQLKIYSNEEKTRTFIAIQVDELYSDKMYDLLERVNRTMSEFRLSLFYEKPSFHISLLWCLGDKTAALTKHIETLNLHLQNERESLKINIQELHCKSGNKEFKLKLK